MLFVYPRVTKLLLSLKVRHELDILASGIRNVITPREIPREQRYFMLSIRVLLSYRYQSAHD